MKFLKDDFKKQDFKRVYLLYGEERYLVDYYARLFTEKLLDSAGEMMNKDSFDGKEAPVEAIIGAANTLPFFCDTRLVYIRDSRLFTTGRKEATEALAHYLPQTPESTILIFIETDVEKRNRLYKAVTEIGRAVEFATQNDKELIKWIRNVFKKKGKYIHDENALLLLRTVSRNMTLLSAETDKLNDYLGNRQEVSALDIETVCSPSLETRVFDLVAAVANGKTELALVMYRNMLLLKEQPIMILTMIIRQFRLILQCKYLSDKKTSASVIAKTLALRSFAVDEYIRQGRKVTHAQLLQALADCQEADTRVKTGLLNAETSIEMIITQYGYAVR